MPPNPEESEDDEYDEDDDYDEEGDESEEVFYKFHVIPLK